jgi:hypothetical protein
MNFELNAPYSGDAEASTFKKIKSEKEEIQSEGHEQTM